jgi:indolepyruvate ferredoxin oxidoreductase beta subunit
MIPDGEADYLIVLDSTQVEVNRAVLKPSGRLLDPSLLAGRTLKNEKAINVALLGALSCHLPFDESLWNAAIARLLAPKLHALNFDAFLLGRSI